MTNLRDHGGGLDAAIEKYGGTRADWLDLSTGINPVPYPVGDVSQDAWTALPDIGARDRLLAAARRFWSVPDGVDILAAPGASALIARLPNLLGGVGKVRIEEPTYNEWAAAFENAGWRINGPKQRPNAMVYVHPNNPDGVAAAPPAQADGHEDLTAIYDESFCDTAPSDSYIGETPRAKDYGLRDILVLKSFGKFWGLAGLRLGFLIGPQNRIDEMAEMLGPWPVAGPALEIGARALDDMAWADATRTRLDEDFKRLDKLMAPHAQRDPLGTPLFRLYTTKDAAELQDKLAQSHIWSRTFPYSKTWIRLGLPAPDRWDQLETALR
ncbi:threonine-phosphate decarboxylase [Litoreibacter roseus]|uniref:Aminotransferase n=1 Tax=Litoreibacter roseus TaxID=2601869 RepID=A0A6N6JF84_9RHOB|nr:threonine-phosphate decarboxylase [Litoreibacter roseus]GFE65011.1 threonine-phosphate decarboxylase [Litoreibacter roseus]